MNKLFKNSEHKSTCENCSDKKPKRDLSCCDRGLSDVIKTISSIAAVAASIATWFTVVEMRNERNQLYKPHLIFESSQYSDDYETTAWGVWDVRSLIALDDDEEEYPVLETTVYNIGSDAAIDIEINFLLDNYKEYVTEITQYYKNNSIDISDDKFSIYYNEMKIYDFVSDSDFIIKKPFLLSGESINIAIPQEFCKLLYYLNCCTNGDYEWQPTIHLQISYLDLQGNHYTIDYELLIKTVISVSEQGKNYFHVDYEIEQGYYNGESELFE